VRKLNEHGQSCWLLLIDFIKAFNRVPCELLWPLMEKLDVPPTLVAVLKALHAKVNVRFLVEGVARTPWGAKSVSGRVICWDRIYSTSALRER
jgi:hypothetical protein